jgi:hypothetical protein
MMQMFATTASAHIGRIRVGTILRSGAHFVFGDFGAGRFAKAVISEIKVLL